MSTPIWDTGAVLASTCATDCDRCDIHGYCVQIYVLDGGRTHREPASQVNLCLACFLSLAYEVRMAAERE